MRPEPCGFITRAALRIVCMTPVRFTPRTCPSPRAGSCRMSVRPRTGSPAPRRGPRWRTRRRLRPAPRRRRRRALYGVLVADVDDEWARVEAARTERLGARGEPLLVDVGQGDPGAAFREHLGHREAEPARRARDDRRDPRTSKSRSWTLVTGSGRPARDLSLAQPVEHVVHLLEAVSLAPQCHAPRACSWRSSQRSIQLPTRFPSDCLADDEADRRVRHHAAVADDRVDALPREHFERSAVRRVGADEVDTTSTPAPFVSSRAARDVRLLAEDLVRAELARQAAALVGVDGDHPGRRARGRAAGRCARPPTPITAVCSQARGAAPASSPRGRP